MSRGPIGLSIVLFTCIAGIGAYGQAVPSATGAAAHFQAGVESSGFDTDVARSPHPFEYGIGVFADLMWRSLGLEAEARTIQFNEQFNVRQAVVSLGARYAVYNGPFTNSRFTPYAKGMGGLGSADYPLGTMGAHPEKTHSLFATATLGGGVDYRLSHRFFLRGEYEYQFWTRYGRGANDPGLGTANPTGFSVGIGYHLF